MMGKKRANQTNEVMTTSLLHVNIVCLAQLTLGLFILFQGLTFSLWDNSKYDVNDSSIHTLWTGLGLIFAGGLGLGLTTFSDRIWVTGTLIMNIILSGLFIGMLTELTSSGFLLTSVERCGWYSLFVCDQTDVSYAAYLTELMLLLVFLCQFLLTVFSIGLCFYSLYNSRGSVTQRATSLKK
ncbi:hypothetical protein EB796_013190 [Bugula neritina]|uniref:Uncharacterized protein n=1 Tax=Bugula neritina TaxID=10212 RepID=A0A7J7JS57_BUGNE|nr:hypothetical protein EB796_013190 [Bugula neritina]